MTAGRRAIALLILAVLLYALGYRALAAGRLPGSGFLRWVALWAALFFATVAAANIAQDGRVRSAARAAVRRVRARQSSQTNNSARRDVLVAWLLDRPMVRVVGPLAIPAVRASVVERIKPVTAKPGVELDLTVVVLAKDGLEPVLPSRAPRPPWCKVVGTEAELLHEVRAARQRAVRAADEYDSISDSREPTYDYLVAAVVFAPPLSAFHDLELGRLTTLPPAVHWYLQRVEVGGEGEGTVFVAQDRSIRVYAPWSERRRVKATMGASARAATMTEVEAMLALARAYPAPAAKAERVAAPAVSPTPISSAAPLAVGGPRPDESGSTDDRGDDDDEAWTEGDEEEDDTPVFVNWLGKHSLLRVVGANAVPAVRAGLVWHLRPEWMGESISSRTVVVLATGGMERLLPPGAPLPEWVSVVTTEEELVDTARAACNAATAARAAAGGDWLNRRYAAVEVYAPPLSESGTMAVREFLAAGRSTGTGYFFRVIYVGDVAGRRGPTIDVDEDGRATPLTEGTRCPPEARAFLMTEQEAVDRLTGYGFAAPAAAPALAIAPIERRLPGFTTVIEVKVFGGVRVVIEGREVPGPSRAKSLELLALLAAHRDGITTDAAAEHLLRGGRTAKRGRAYVRKLASELRSFLREAAGLPSDVEVVQHANGRYRLDPRLVKVDVWQFDDAVASGGDGVADLYTGPFAGDEDYTWATSLRRRYGKQAVTLIVAAATNRQASGDLDGALGIIERAIEAEPHAEELYQLLMDFERAAGRGQPAVRRTYDLLERRLAEVGQRPSAESRARRDSF